MPRLAPLFVNYRAAGALLLALLAAGPAAGQPYDVQRAADLLPAPGILRNSISNLHVQGDSLWVGPWLSLTTDEGQTWFVPDTDSLAGTRNRVFSLDVEGDVIWAGLGLSLDDVASAGGFLVSEDGGRTFAYRFPQLDEPDDSVLVFGRNTLRALPVIVPQQSPPFDIDYDPATGTVWVAGWASGHRRSTDGGRTWQRVVLPPEPLNAIHPDSTYDFVFEPERGTLGFRNYLGFSVLVDETGTVWAGTPAGINRSTDGGASWTRFSREGTGTPLTGNWVISIEEQPLPGRNPIWMATWNASDVGGTGIDGITVTRDGGATFEPVLRGERVFDFAFRGQTVYVAGTNGLLISDDGGITWRTIRSFVDAAQPDRGYRPGARVVSVATTDEALWVGTEDGLFRSENEGLTWQLFRAEVPLTPEARAPKIPAEAVPEVEAYAYPNPFSPIADRFIRIHYELDDSTPVRVRIFDFSMTLVRDLGEEAQPAGPREVRWDGTDDRGARVANGTYFYAVEAGGTTFWGKILVLE